MDNKSKRRLLIVDDNKDLCRVISDVMKDRNYEVSTAHDFNSGLSKLSNQTFDLLLLDYGLPGGNGMEILEKISHLQASLLIIVMSAHGRQWLRDKALASGAVDFLDKPFSIVHLIQTVENFL